MSVITDVEKWGNTHRPGFLDFFRVILGGFITYKGLYFITHMNELETMTSQVNFWFTGAVLAHYVIFAHVLAGPLIVIGLFTRIAAALQVPVLIGAILFINNPMAGFTMGNHIQLEISIIVLIGLIVFMVFGAGRFSLDAKRRKEIEASVHH